MAKSCQAEVVEQRFGAVVLPHQDQQASDDQNQTKHDECFLLTCFCRISSRVGVEKVTSISACLRQSSNLGMLSRFKGKTAG